MYYQEMTIKNKIVVILSSIILIVSLYFKTKEYFVDKEKYTIKYEYVNIKDMAQAKVTNKQENNDNIFNSLLTNLKLESKQEQKKLDIEEVNFVKTTNSKNDEIAVPRQIWYLPTEVGNVTQYPNYGHVAYDITSYRGYAETIHPVANGVVSGMYTDNAGALIVTVLHDINGVKYTSQYVHLSSYASNLYVGQPVTINDALGQMGTTGNSTGVHLHIAVLDCALFDPNDPNCPDLNSWYQYDKKRLNENFYGLGTLVYVPNVWYNR